MQKAVFEGAKKPGKTPDKLTEEEIMQILENMDVSTISSVASTATNGEEFKSITDRISAILDRAMSTNVTSQKVERSLDQIVPELNAARNDSEAREPSTKKHGLIDRRVFLLSESYCFQLSETGHQ